MTTRASPRRQAVKTTCWHRWQSRRAWCLLWAAGATWFSPGGLRARCKGRRDCDWQEQRWVTVRCRGGEMW